MPLTAPAVAKVALAAPDVRKVPLTAPDVAKVALAAPGVRKVPLAALDVPRAPLAAADVAKVPLAASPEGPRAVVRPAAPVQRRVVSAATPVGGAATGGLPFIQRAPLLGTRPLPVLGATAAPAARPTAGRPVVRPSSPVTAGRSATPVARAPRTSPPAEEPPPPAVRWAASPNKPSTPEKPDPPGAQDLDDLARRLLEPVGRLLRAELRHGRERAGRLHDWRR